MTTPLALECDLCHQPISGGRLTFYVGEKQCTVHLGSISCDNDREHREREHNLILAERNRLFQRFDMGVKKRVSK